MEKACKNCTNTYEEVLRTSAVIEEQLFDCDHLYCTLIIPFFYFV